jgi:hypothetical protein
MASGPAASTGPTPRHRQGRQPGHEPTDAAHGSANARDLGQTTGAVVFGRPLPLILRVIMGHDADIVTYKPISRRTGTGRTGPGLSRRMLAWQASRRVRSYADAVPALALPYTSRGDASVGHAPGTARICQSHQGSLFLVIRISEALCSLKQRGERSF